MNDRHAATSTIHLKTKIKKKKLKTLETSAICPIPPKTVTISIISRTFLQQWCWHVFVPHTYTYQFGLNPMQRSPPYKRISHRSITVQDGHFGRCIGRSCHADHRKQRCPPCLWHPREKKVNLIVGSDFATRNYIRKRIKYWVIITCLFARDRKSWRRSSYHVWDRNTTFWLINMVKIEMTELKVSDIVWYKDRKHVLYSLYIYIF